MQLACRLLQNDDQPITELDSESGILIGQKFCTSFSFPLDTLFF
jgi:hypothetical protein